MGNREICITFVPSFLHHSFFQKPRHLFTIFHSTFVYRLFQKSFYKYEQLKSMNRNHHRKYWGKKIISRVYKKRSTEFDSDFSYFFLFWIFKFAYIEALDEIRLGSYSDYSKISAHFRTDGFFICKSTIWSSSLSFKFIDFNESMNTIPYDIWELMMSSSPIRKDFYFLCYSP